MVPSEDNKHQDRAGTVTANPIPVPSSSDSPSSVLSPRDRASMEKTRQAGDSDRPRHVAQNAQAPGDDLPAVKPVETGGQAGPEPTRYGDWEKKGRCTDF